ncbi:MAG: hypothetical protein KDC38_07790 [Planctomycetes bacterium]|nr:hypothetical protein [Planctomycetota bacterium]
MTHKLFRSSTPLLFAVLLFSPLRAIEERTVTVENVPGSTLELAIMQGLVRALEQVQGIDLRSTQGAELRRAEAEREITAGMEDYFERIAIEDVAFGNISKVTNGLVRSYKITQQTQYEKTKDWTVSLEVVVPIYDPDHPRPGTKWTVAVLGFTTPSSTFDLGGVRVQASEMKRKFLDRSTSQFTQSGRYLVLDRKTKSAVDAERDFIRSGDASKDEKLALGKGLGADYLVTGSIEELGWTETSKTLVTGRTVVRQTASYHAFVNVIQVSTGLLKFSQPIQRSFGNEDLAALPGELQQLRRDDLLLELLAFDLSQQVTDALYPQPPVELLVIKTGDKDVGLPDGTSRRGEVLLTTADGVAVGDRLDVFVQGEELTNPKTGESLGREETRVATVQVVSVSANFLTAAVVDGEFSAIGRGAVCRRAAKQ